MKAITLSPELSERIEKAAQIRGTDAPALAESLLSQILSLETTKVFSVMDFAGVAPTGRSAQEIDTEIQEGRGEKPATEVKKA